MDIIPGKGNLTAITPPSPAYPAATAMSIASFLVILLILPPLIWHLRNRNIGATALIAWIVLINFFTFINALIWPNDDITHWFNGKGLCDIETKLSLAVGVAAPAALVCVLRALAAVMDTDRPVLNTTRAQRRRGCIVDVLWCTLPPIFTMIGAYVVQPIRYYIFGISGCTPAVDQSWLAVVILFMPPVIFTLIDLYYAVLVIVRLYRYRRSFSSVLQSSSTTKSRFLRLFLLCLTWILASTPVQLYVLLRNVTVPHTPYSWRIDHDPATFKTMFMVPSDGVVVYDRYIWLGSGVMVFLFFGMGRDAVSMYRQGLLAAGLGMILPGLRVQQHGSTGRRSTSESLSSLGSKAKLYWKRKTSSSTATWTTNSFTSRGSVTDSQPSPKTLTFVETIDRRQLSPQTTSDLEKGTPSQERQLHLSKLISVFKPKRASPTDSDALPLQPIATGQADTVSSQIYATLPSPTLLMHKRGVSDEEVVVRKEVRQGSESVEGLSGKGDCAE